MCNAPNSIRTGLSLDPWEIGELEARASVPLRQVVVPTIPSIFAASLPDDQRRVFILAGAVCNVWEFVPVQTYHA